MATRLDRAKHERMFYMGRRGGDENNWQFVVTGSTGKVYTVTIMRHVDNRGRGVKCNCMDHIMRKKNCKHILFLCMRVLKLEMSRVTELAAGRAIDSEELAEIARNAGGDVAHEFAAPEHLKNALRSLVGNDFEHRGAKKVEPRKPEEGDDCPICFEDLREGAVSFCGYGCGKGIHKECFDMWASSKRAERAEVTCVYCRTAWYGCGTSSRGNSRGLLYNGRLIDLGVHDSRIAKREARPGKRAKGKARTKKSAPRKQAGSSSRDTGEGSHVAPPSRRSARQAPEPAPAGVRRSARLAAKRVEDPDLSTRKGNLGTTKK